MDTTRHQPIILSRLCSGTVLTVRFTLIAVSFNGILPQGIPKNPAILRP